MKERPILFSAPMVRALLAGTKTQTRRLVKPDSGSDINPVWIAETDAWQWATVESRRRCPYGAPGDRLWVREAFIHEPADYCWEASVSIPCRPESTTYRADFDGDSRGAGWTPSIHMPRRLSRIDLEVTGIRIERLQDCSEADAIAEGIEPEGEEWRDYLMPHTQCCLDPRSSYRTLWESINGEGSWGANPWVWVVGFKRLP